MVTARARLKPWPIKPAERAAMRAAQQAVAAIFAHGTTEQQRQQALAELLACDNPRQPSLPLKVSQ